MLYVINVYFDRTDVSEVTDVNKTGASKTCDISHYWYFLNYSFMFQTNVCNSHDLCHDLLMMSMNLSDIATLNIKSSDYRCIISLISKNEGINFMQNADLTEHYKPKNLLSFMKMGKEILTCDNIEIEKNKFYRNTFPIF